MMYINAVAHSRKRLNGHKSNLNYLSADVRLLEHYATKRELTDAENTKLETLKKQLEYVNI